MNGKVKECEVLDKDGKVVSESANEFQTVLDKLSHLEEHMVYMSKLLEAVVNNLSLGNKRKTDAQEIMKLNSQLMAGLFVGKEFQGKELFMELIEKIQKMGVE